MISPEDHFNSSLTMLLEHFSINKTNTQFIKPTYSMNEFISKQVDATTAFRSNELDELNKKNIPYNIIDPIEYGFPTNANNLFTSYEKVKNNPEQIQRLLSANARGWDYALNNIDEVAHIIQKKYNQNLSLEHLMYEGKVTKDLMLLDIYPIGEINRAFVLKNYEQLLLHDAIDIGQDSSKLLLEKKDLQGWIKEKYIQRTEYTFAILITIFFITLLVLLLFWSLKMKSEISKRLKAEVDLKFLAEHDPLTSLPNRILFLDRLQQAIKTATRHKNNLAVLYVDLDRFKEINDSLGHTIGDLLLKELANRLVSSVRLSDTVARVGGDEFIIIIENFNSSDVISNVIQTILHSLRLPMYIENHELYSTVSLGISVFPDDGNDSDTLIKNADAAMYKAKANGRNNYQFYTSDMTEKALERIVLETQLRQSLIKDEMEVYYQLQVDLEKRSVIGMEALVRWNHPLNGLVAPGYFIPLAEDIGFIVELDEWVMREAVIQFQTWYDEGLNPGKISLNLSVLRLEKDGLIKNIDTVLKDSGLDPKFLSLEVTESQIMQDPQKAVKCLNELSKKGIELSIDDFGTGYSSLSYLKKLPINKLKIDRSFVMDIPHDKDDKEITKTIIAMAHNLNLIVIAEGVETQEQSDFLQANLCTEVQGYLYHKPAPAHEIEEKLKSMFNE